MTIALTSVTTWDPVNGAGRPLALPGSKGRTTLTVGNPDLVPLDGDGSGSAIVIGFAVGSPASTNALTYTDGASAADDDFTAGNGNTPRAMGPLPATGRPKRRSPSAISTPQPDGAPRQIYAVRSLSGALIAPAETKRLLQRDIVAGEAGEAG